MPPQVPYTPLGRLEELDHLDLAGVLDYLRTYLDNFLLDADVAMAFAGRLLREPGLGGQVPALRALAYVLGKAAQAAPFDARIADLAARLAGDPAQTRRAPPCSRPCPRTRRPGTSPAAWASPGSWRPAATGSPRTAPPSRHAVYAAQLLALDFFQGLPPGDWITPFAPPAELATAWRRLLFCHLAEIGQDAAALDLWPQVEASDPDETALNLAAEVFAGRGRSRGPGPVRPLPGTRPRPGAGAPPPGRAGRAPPPGPRPARDPGGGGVPVLLQQGRPARPDPGPPGRHRPGPRRVRVLVNGCSDDSEAVARAAADRFRAGTTRWCPCR